MAEFIEAEEVEEAMEDLEARILSVLPRGEFDERHIPHSINVPLDDPAFEETVRRFVPDLGQRVIVHCSGLSSASSSDAAARLEAMGYTNVFDFKAGIAGWAAENRPFEAGQATRRGERPARRSERPRREGQATERQT
jgi:rhodanese-related sulfurtransferase